MYFINLKMAKLWRINKMNIGSRVVLQCETKEIIPFTVDAINGNLVHIIRKVPVFVCGQPILRDDIQIQHVECLKEI